MASIILNDVPAWLVCLEPWLVTLKADWLAGAEISRPELWSGGSSVGLSFFFRDDRELSAFLALAGLPLEWTVEEHKIRQTLGLVPRSWIKLIFRDGHRVGYARYYAFPSSDQIPLTSIRLLLRRFGADPATVVPLLEPCDGDRRTGVFVSFKELDEVGTARLSVRFPRELLEDYLGYLSQRELVEPSLVEFHANVASTQVTDRVYLTFQPGNPGVLAIDYREAAGYRKCRRVQGRPEWTVYRSLSDEVAWSVPSPWER